MILLIPIHQKECKMSRFLCFTLIALAFLFIGTQAMAQKDALVLYFTFDENNGDTVGDRSGNGNDGTINNANWIDGKYGAALKFEAAANSFVEVADSPSLNPETEISYMAWFNSDVYSSANGIISKYTGAGNNRSYNLRVHHTLMNALSTEISSNGVFQVGISTTEVHSEAILVEGQWHHAAITFEAGEFLRMYVDGTMVSESDAAATVSIFDNNTPMRIGTDFNDEAKRFFDGIIDEVAVFNRVLTDAEVQAAMDGDILAVDASDKLTTTWGGLKNRLR